MEMRIRNGKQISAEEKKLARERAMVIVQVHSGMLSAREGAQRLGVSRKTYYEWEERALEAMTLALENRPLRRPPGSLDKAKEDLRRQIGELQKKLDLAEKTIEVKELLAAYDSFKDLRAKKNKSKRRQTGRKR